MTAVTIVVRLFQAGTNKEAYKQEVFERAARAMRALLASNEVRGMIVVTNTEPGNRLAEIVDDEGLAPTTRAVHKAFAEDLERVTVVQCEDWGRNPGSAHAVTVGCQEAIRRFDSDHIMVWSSELAVGLPQLATALAFMESRRLDIVGFHREGWYDGLQYHVFQNTGAIYRRDVLEKNAFFSKDCDGNDGRMIAIPEYGEVLLAGMDDFHFLLRHLRQADVVRWGMVCRHQPLAWNTDFEPGSERERLHLQKVARQRAVMYAYIADIFGARDPAHQKRILARIFSGMQMD